MMKRIQSGILGLLVGFSSLLGSCGDKNLVSEDGYIHVPFAKGIEKEQIVKLSDIADRVEYIWLETREDCLLPNIVGAHTAITDKYIFLYDKNDIFQFARDGHFIRKVGKKGNGPGEYPSVTQLDVLPEKKELYALVFNYWKIYVYDTETGEFLRDIPMASRNSLDFMMYNDTMTVAFNQSFGKKSSIRLALGNLSGDVLQTFQYPYVDLDGTGVLIMMPNNRNIYRYDNNIQYKDYYNDTIFAIGREQLEPRYILDLEKYAIPTEKRVEYSNSPFKKEAQPYIRCEVIETNKHIFMPYLHWDLVFDNDSTEKMMAIYNKTDGSCCKVSGNVLQNDLSGGVPIQPIGTVGNDAIFSICPTDKLMEEAEVNPEIKKLIEKNHLKFDDNPMIMIVHLKKGASS